MSWTNEALDGTFARTIAVVSEGAKTILALRFDMAHWH